MAGRQRNAGCRQQVDEGIGRGRHGDPDVNDNPTTCTFNATSGRVECLPFTGPRGLTIVREVPTALPEVHVDAMRLEQVLANLVANAVKFTERGGQIIIRAEAIGDVVRVGVIDTGIGIPAEHLSHIFDRYWHARRQSRTVGTGLGLAIARGIVDAHGGAIPSAVPL